VPKGIKQAHHDDPVGSFHHVDFICMMRGLGFCSGNYRKGDYGEIRRMATLLVDRIKAEKLVQLKRGLYCIPADVPDGWVLPKQPGSVDELLAGLDLEDEALQATQA
jgi:hypothetical protein